MPNKIPLYGFRPPVQDELPVEVVQIASMPKIVTRPVPTRQTFYQIFWVEKGSGVHVVDFVEDEILPNSLYFIGPGQVNYWDVDASLHGVAILFDASLFLTQKEDFSLDQLTFFRAINNRSAIYPKDKKVKELHRLISQIEQEYLGNAFARSTSLVAMIQLLLIQSQRISLNAESRPAPVSASVHLTAGYLSLVEKCGIEHHKVDWYADELGVTVAHLSKCVKAVKGITAGTFLRNRIILEAKRLFVHTELTSVEIAIRLNFSDPSYFGRFFKRETGVTPSSFRSEFPTKYQNLTTD